MLLRERHELERKLADIEDRERCARNDDQELVNRLRRDLKKTKILLHDARLMLQQVKSDAPNKAMLRQLRNQVSDMTVVSLLTWRFIHLHYLVTSSKS